MILILLLILRAARLAGGTQATFSVKGRAWEVCGEPASPQKIFPDFSSLEKSGLDRNSTLELGGRESGGPLPRSGRSLRLSFP